VKSGLAPGVYQGAILGGGLDINGNADAVSLTSGGTASYNQ
jgi:hypothetical protein